MSECTNRNNHSLGCLIIEMVRASPYHRIHVDQISHQLSKLQKLYCSMPIRELRQKICDAVLNENSIIYLERNICYLKKAELVIDLTDDKPEVKDYNSNPSLISSESSEYTKTDNLNQSVKSPVANLEKNCPSTSNININSNDLLDALINCFKQAGSTRLSTLDIYAIMTLTFPEKYTDEMISDTLLRNKRLFKMEYVPGQLFLTWTLKKTSFRRMSVKRKNYKLTWKQIIASVLGRQRLILSEIEQRIKSCFPEVSGKWMQSVSEALHNNDCFKKFGREWYIDKEYFRNF